MNRRSFLKTSSALAASALLPATRALATAARPRPNVLFVMCDGLSPDLPASTGSGGPTMPNFRRLMARSTRFERAYCDSPACGPSRTALLTGVRSSRSGVYYNSHSFRQATGWISKVATLPQQFRQHGYLTVGYGFIAHHRGLDEDSSYSPGHFRIFNDRKQVRWTEKQLLEKILPGTRVKMQSGSLDFGVLPDDWDAVDTEKQQQDTQFANDTIGLLMRTHDQPFFATCGFYRPHVGWTVPERYYERFPLDAIRRPAGYSDDDLADVPFPGQWIATHRREHAFIVGNGLWEKAIQAYYASVAYMDDQLGRVLDALDRGPNRNNTVVVFTTDHGWHNGEKNHWSKFALWEQACRVSLTISMPGGSPQVCASPASLLDLYPTLLSLCEVPAPQTHTLDGRNLAPLLLHPDGGDNAPVLITFGPGNHAVCDEQFRYIRYRDGSEELYDHGSDPHEFRNLAGSPGHGGRKESLRRHLPASEAPQIRYETGDPPVDSNGWNDEAFRQPSASANAPPK